MNYQEFFKELEGCSVSTCFYENNTTGLTIEDIYQAFEARLIDKLVVMGPSLIACGKLVSKKELGVET